MKIAICDENADNQYKNFEQFGIEYDMDSPMMYYLAVPVLPR